MKGCDYRHHVRPCFNAWIIGWMSGGGSSLRYCLSQQLRYIRQSEGRRAAIGYLQIVRTLGGGEFFPRKAA